MTWLEFFQYLFGRHPRPGPTPTPTPSPTPTPTPDGAALSLRLLDAHNAIRAAAGVPPLTHNARLYLAATNKAATMAATGILEHYDPDGSMPQDRARAVGYTDAVGENIAFDAADVPAVMALWEGHLEHYDNIVDRDYVEMGAAMQNGFWAVDFGTSWPAAQIGVVKSRSGYNASGLKPRRRPQ